MGRPVAVHGRLSSRHRLPNSVIWFRACCSSFSMHMNARMLLACSAQAALRLRADDAVESAVERASKAELLAEQAAKEAAVAAAQGAMHEVDAAKLERRAAAAAELSKPYSVIDQVRQVALHATCGNRPAALVRDAQGWQRAKRPICDWTKYLFSATD